MKNFRLILLMFSVSLFALSSCGKDDDGGEKPPKGILDGAVTSDSSGEAIEGAKIDLYFENGDPAGISLLTDADGNYSEELDPGNYSARIYKQGFKSIPPKGVSPIGFSIIDGQTTTKNYKMLDNEVVNAGWITGRLSVGDEGVSGAMVIASNGNKSFSAISNNDGYYTIYNVAADNYDVKAWKQGFNSETKSATVTEDTETADVDIVMTEDAVGSISGTAKSVAGDAVPVDVTLIEKVSGEAIPGLSVMTNAQENYEITGVPNGTYIAKATYKNDTKVVDPDGIFKFGEPVVTINNDAKTKDFDVTGAVTLNSPTNVLSEVTAVEITELNPTFVWTPYPSTTDYVFELSTENGEVIWGGISGDYGSMTKEIVIIKGDETTDADGNVIYTYPASAPALEVGRVYRWRIYASKNDVRAAEGWKLISMSEDQMGLIKIVE